jgi:uncharacterized HAD superfamily protein
MIIKRSQINKPNATIFDLDGCLCDSEYALRHILGVKDPSNDHWNSFYRDLKYSVLNKWCLTLLNNFRIYNKIIIITAREERSRSITEEWLRRHDILYDALFMRPEGNRQPSHVVKENIYLSEIKDNYCVRTAIDDDISIINMYSKHNIDCIPIHCECKFCD